MHRIILQDHSDRNSPDTIITEIRTVRTTAMEEIIIAITAAVITEAVISAVEREDFLTAIIQTEDRVRDVAETARQDHREKAVRRVRVMAMAVR